MSYEFSSFIKDNTGRKCPDCGSRNIGYTEAEAVRYGRYDRDYECQNCGTEWLMFGPLEETP